MKIEYCEAADCWQLRHPDGSLEWEGSQEDCRDAALLVALRAEADRLEKAKSKNPRATKLAVEKLRRIADVQMKFSGTEARLLRRAEGCDADASYEVAKHGRATLHALKQAMVAQAIRKVVFG